MNREGPLSFFASVLSVVIMLLTLLTNVSAQSSESPWSSPVDMTQGSIADTGQFGTLLCDSRQNLHLLWSHSSPDGALLMYQNDFAGQFSPATDVIAFSGSTMIRLSAAISEETETLHVIWQSAYINGHVYYSSVPLAKAHLATAWTVPSLIHEGVDAAQLYADGSGAIHMIIGESTEDGLQGSLLYMQSQDNGATWSSPKVIFTNYASMPSGISGAIAVDDSGGMHVGITIRSQEYGIYSEVGYIKSTDGGLTWSPYLEITRDGTTFQGVSTLRPFTFGTDEVHLTWHDPRRMHQVSYDQGETWSEPSEMMSLGAAFGGPNMLVKDSAGTVHAILATGGGVFSVTRIGDSWVDYQTVDNRPLDPHGQNMVVCQGNQLHVVYYDRLGDVKVWYSSRTIDAPHLDRQAWPVAAAALPSPASTLTPEPEVTSTPANNPTPTASIVLPTIPTSSNSMQPLLLATSAVVVLLSAVVLVAVRRRG